MIGKTHTRFEKVTGDMKMRTAWILGAAFSISACAPSSHILIGTARPPISPAEVKIYNMPPAQFQEIALLDATSSSVFGTGGQKSMDKVIERLKVQAAQLGANGVILGDVTDRQTGSIGTGVGSGSASGNTAVGVGASGSLGIYKKTGKGTAIYVPPG
jgi:uncharacterized protein YbjQ (UPF0145 family)